MRCVPTFDDCSDEDCYRITNTVDGVCDQPVYFDRTRPDGERVHHHEEAPAPRGAGARSL